MLSAADNELLTRTGAGTPMGDVALLPPPVEWKVESDYWELEDEHGWGPPDLIMEMPEPFLIPPDGPDLFRAFPLLHPILEA